jgi:hypothetical protein
VLRPMLGISLAFMNRFSKEYFEPSLCVADERGGSGSVSCPADRDLRELVECESTGSCCRCEVTKVF